MIGWGKWNADLCGVMSNVFGMHMMPPEGSFLVHYLGYKQPKVALIGEVLPHPPLRVPCGGNNPDFDLQGSLVARLLWAD